MAEYVVVDKEQLEADLTTVADSIRAKANVTEDLAFPSGFKSTVDSIEVGSGGSGDIDISKFAIPNTVTGTGLITCDYVNENEHNVEVKLASDTITDFSGVEVKTCGKNLFKLAGREIDDNGGVWSGAANPRNFTGNKVFIGLSASNYFASQNINSYEINDNSVTMNCNNTSYGLSFDFKVKAGQTYRLSRTGGASSMFGFFDKNGYTMLNPLGEGEVILISEGVEWLLITLLPDKTNEDVIITDIQLELSGDITDYEPYEGKTYISNADGTVDGVKSISPIMNIICYGVDITAKYYFVAERDRNPDYCTKVDYRFHDLNAFGKKEIEITNDKMTAGTQMFYQKVKNTTVEHIIVNSISDTAGIYEMFTALAGADTTLKHITLNLDNNNNNVSYAFQGLEALEIIDGKPLSFIKVNQNYLIENTFYNCKALKEVRFVSNSLVYSISFHISPLLSLDTITSIIEGLADMTEKT